MARRILVTGSSGHLGEALVRVLRDGGSDVLGLDVLPSPFTDLTGSVADRALVRRALEGADAVLHAATLHKPHVGSHARQDFVETNVSGTLALLEEAVAAGVGRFVFTSTTSAFGRALTPAAGEPAAWVTEDVRPVPRNVYGATKVAAEDLCELVHRDHGLPCLILRTSRFFPEADDRDDARAAYEDANLKTLELLHRRVDLEDVVSAHLARARAGAGARLRPLHRQRDDPVHARGPRRAAPRRGGRDPPPRARGRRRLSVPAAGGCRRAWTACTSTPVPARSSAGRRCGTSPMRSSASPPGEAPRSELAAQVGAKGYHATPTGVYTRG